MKSVKDIQQDMAAVRGDLPRDVEQLVQQAKTMTDWQSCVRKHPWAAMAVAAAVGYLVVPRRRRLIRLDADTVAELTGQTYAAVGSLPRRRRGGGLEQRLLDTATQAVVRLAVGYVNRKVKQLIGDGVKTPCE